VHEEEKRYFFLRRGLRLGIRAGDGRRAAMTWRAGEAWPLRVGLGPVQRGDGPHSEGVGPFNPFPKFQSFFNIQTLSNL
jgi:hypothetical protein